MENQQHSIMVVLKDQDEPNYTATHFVLKKTPDGYDIPASITGLAEAANPTSATMQATVDELGAQAAENLLVCNTVLHQDKDFIRDMNGVTVVGDNSAENIQSIRIALNSTTDHFLMSREDAYAVAKTAGTDRLKAALKPFGPLEPVQSKVAHKTIEVKAVQPIKAKKASTEPLLKEKAAVLALGDFKDGFYKRSDATHYVVRLHKDKPIGNLVTYSDKAATSISDFKNEFIKNAAKVFGTVCGFMNLDRNLSDMNYSDFVSCQDQISFCKGYLISDNKSETLDQVSKSIAAENKKAERNGSPIRLKLVSAAQMAKLNCK